MTLTGFTRRAFYSLVEVLFPEVEEEPVGEKRGRPPSLDKYGQTGLVLFYLGPKMQVKHLCSLFGITPSCCSRFVDEMLETVVHHQESFFKS